MASNPTPDLAAMSIDVEANAERTSLGGRAFADLLVLGARACQAPMALLSAPRPNGTWSTLTSGLHLTDSRENDPLFEILAAGDGLLEIPDLLVRLPSSPLVMFPYEMRWGYGAALHDRGQPFGVIAVLDREVRVSGNPERRAMAALVRQVENQLSQWRISSMPTVADACHPPAPVPVAVQAVGRASADLLATRQVAEIFDVTPRTVMNWAADGRLPSMRTLGGRLRFSRHEIVRLASLSTPAP